MHSPSSCNPDARPNDTCPNDARWFVDEVHAHDAALKSYLRHTFPAIRDVDDIAQESYLRIWRQRAAKPIWSAKAFLFKIAQRLAIDTDRRQRRSPFVAVGNLDDLDGFETSPSAADSASHRERLEYLIGAIDSLPPRCRDVVILRKLKVLSQRETAAFLGISEKGVEVQLARGLDRCRDFMRRHGVAPLHRDEF